MAQGEFTKEEAEETQKTVKEMFEALPKKKQMEFIGHWNDVALFVGAAAKHAPTEADLKKSKKNVKPL